MALLPGRCDVPGTAEEEAPADDDDDDDDDDGGGDWCGSGGSLSASVREGAGCVSSGPLSCRQLPVALALRLSAPKVDAPPPRSSPPRSSLLWRRLSQECSPRRPL